MKQKPDNSPLPLAACAGFPSPADDYIEAPLDLHTHVVKHPSATFFVRVSGDSMRGAGIRDRDLLVVDRSLEPADKSIVIAVLDGAMSVRRLRRCDGVARLATESGNAPAMGVVVNEGDEIWGVVTHALHAF